MGEVHCKDMVLMHHAMHFIQQQRGEICHLREHRWKCMQIIAVSQISHYVKKDLILTRCGLSVIGPHSHFVTLLGNIGCLEGTRAVLWDTSVECRDIMTERCHVSAIVFKVLSHTWQLQIMIMNHTFQKSRKKDVQCYHQEDIGGEVVKGKCPLKGGAI